MIVLSHQRPLAIGNLRAIHQHPDHPQLLIKTLRPEALARRWDAPGQWRKRLPRARQYNAFVRELKEFIALQARMPNEIPPIARVIGVVETDLGLGMVSEKVVDATGAMATSVHSLYRQHGGAPPWIDAAFEQLLEQLLRFNVLVGDLHAGNIVYGTDSRGGPPRLILVDGFGEKHWIPITSMSRWWNRRNTERLYRRLRTILTQPVSTWGPAVRED